MDRILKNKKAMSNYWYFATLIFLVSCSGSEGGEGNENGDDSSMTSVIKPPFEGDFHNDTIFRIDPTQPTLVESPNGSSIEIPANIIVDGKGKAVKTPVDLSFVQYH